MRVMTKVGRVIYFGTYVVADIVRHDVHHKVWCVQYFVL